ncbi:MAG: hypothetical protein ABI597_12465 [Gammaproteobacteria bacterium]
MSTTRIVSDSLNISKCVSTEPPADEKVISLNNEIRDLIREIRSDPFTLAKKTQAVNALLTRIENNKEVDTVLLDQLVETSRTVQDKVNKEILKREVARFDSPYYLVVKLDSDPPLQPTSHDSIMTKLYVTSRDNQEKRFNEDDEAQNYEKAKQYIATKKDLATRLIVKIQNENASKALILEYKSFSGTQEHASRKFSQYFLPELLLKNKFSHTHETVETAKAIPKP